MSDEETGKHADPNSKEDIESFMDEINEYYENMTKCKNSCDTEGEDSNEDEEDSDSLYKTRSKIESLKEALNTEKAKVKKLEEVIKKQNEYIETLKDKNSQQNNEHSDEINTSNEKTEIKVDNRCRYWNRGFCREKEKCKFNHPEQNCAMFLDHGKCEDKLCRRRHRRECRYFKQEVGCFRGSDCEFLHKINNRNTKFQQERIQETRMSGKYSSKESESFKCDHCSFKCGRKNTLIKHINTKHSGFSSLNPISSFIFRNGLEEFSEEYKFYFNKFGFSREEEDHVEKVISSYGADYVVQYIK